MKKKLSKAEYEHKKLIKAKIKDDNNKAKTIPYEFIPIDRGYELSADSIFSQLLYLNILTKGLYYKRKH